MPAKPNYSLRVPPPPNYMNGYDRGSLDDYHENDMHWLLVHVRDYVGAVEDATGAAVFANMTVAELITSIRNMHALRQHQRLEGQAKKAVPLRSHSIGEVRRG